jgi:hypothetical protein
MPILMTLSDRVQGPNSLELFQSLPHCITSTPNIIGQMAMNKVAGMIGSSFEFQCPSVILIQLPTYAPKQNKVTTSNNFI